MDSTLGDSVKERAEGYGVTYYWTPPRGYSDARNFGIKKSNGEIIAFTDADCVADFYWLSDLVREFLNPNVAGVGGQVDGVFPFTEWVTDDEGCIVFEKNTGIRWKDGRFPIPFLCTANCAYRKTVLEKVGGFPKQLGVGDRGVGGEDVAVSILLQKKGYKLKLIKSAKIVHQPGSRKKDLMNSFKQGRFAYILVKTKADKFKNWFRRLFARSWLDPFGAMLVFIGFLYQSSKVRSEQSGSRTSEKRPGIKVSAQRESA